MVAQLRKIFGDNKTFSPDASNSTLLAPVKVESVMAAAAVDECVEEFFSE